jgi:O-antigen ligase
MRNGFPSNVFLWFIIPVTSSGLIFFYIKYVPLVVPFQLVFLPLLLLVFFVTASEAQRGTLLFIFLFPLVNGLPYFFGIHEPLPHAPAALVLFLFYFQGWLIHFIIFKKKLSLPPRLVKPLLLLSALILISAVITIFRYANFFPSGPRTIYELTVNAQGVTAGGAIMSVVFSALNSLTGFAFLAIILSIPFSAGFVRKSFLVLTWSALLAMLFGLFQHLLNRHLGNNPTSIAVGIINGTFKDALSFGAFLAMISPLLLAMAAVSKGFLRAASSLAFLLSVYLAFFTGSKIGLFSLVLSLAVFLLLRRAAILQRLRTFRRLPLAGLGTAAFLVLVILLMAKGVIPGIQNTKTLTRFGDFRTHLEHRTTRLWPLGLAMLKDYPLTGVGIGSYIVEVSNYAHRRHIDIQPESAENYFIQVGSELGACGILLVLWIMVEIIRLLRIRYREANPPAGQRVLLSGALGGLSAFGPLLLWHTYIGSYEIHYLFWLLAGLVLREESHRAVSGKNASWGRIINISGAAMLVVFGGFSLWSAGHSLSLEVQRQRLGLNRAFGLFEKEQTREGMAFRWTGRYGGLPVTIEQRHMELSLLASHPDIQSRPVKVSLYLLKGFFRQKIPLGEVLLTRPVWRSFVYSVPWVGEDDVILFIKVSRTWNPLKTSGAPDPRNLGVAIGPIYFRESVDLKASGRL